MGARREDYEAVAPPHSFIHVDDFESPQSLAEYLRRLDANDTLYNEYFRWKGTAELLFDTKYWCRLCAMLHLADDVDYVHWYEDYGEWWSGSRVCDSRPADDGSPWLTWRTAGYWKNRSNGGADGWPTTDRQPRLSFYNLEIHPILLLISYLKFSILAYYYLYCIPQDRKRVYIVYIETGCGTSQTMDFGWTMAPQDIYKIIEYYNVVLTFVLLTGGKGEGVKMTPAVNTLIVPVLTKLFIFFIFCSIFCLFFVETLPTTQFVTQLPTGSASRKCQVLTSKRRITAKSPPAATTVPSGTRRHPWGIGIPVFTFESITIQAREIPPPSWGSAHRWLTTGSE